MPTGFGSLMDIDKLILSCPLYTYLLCFGSLMDIDKLIPSEEKAPAIAGFGSLMDIDKLIRRDRHLCGNPVLVL